MIITLVLLLLLPAAVPRNFFNISSEMDLLKIKLYIEKYLSKFPAENHSKRCQWQSTKSIRYATENSLYPVHELKNNLIPVLILSLCIGHGKLCIQRASTYIFFNLLLQFFKSRSVTRLVNTLKTEFARTFPGFTFLLFTGDGCQKVTRRFFL